MDILKLQKLVLINFTQKVMIVVGYGLAQKVNSIETLIMELSFSKDLLNNRGLHAPDTI